MQLQYATLRSYTRLNNSVNGNPNYSVFIEHGDGSYSTLRSSSDSSWCYGLGDQWLDKTISYHLTRSGRIDYMKLTDLHDIFADDLLSTREG
jgi:hypothetical protein